MAIESPVQLPVDRLEYCWPEAFRGKRVGAVLHAASTTTDLRSTLSELEKLSGLGLLSLTALFGPQHGFATTTQDNMIEWEGYRHPRLGIPVYSLYGEHRKPTASMLEDVDVLFLDLMDVGARYYTFIWTMFLCMEACQQRGIPFVVADRPNPIGGILVEGFPQETGYLSFVGLHPIPIRHGKTIGELADQFRRECFPDLELMVLPMTGWERWMDYDATGIPWISPSPNMPTLDSAIVYPGMCLLEGSNLSEGRGTTRPFEYFGAPWIQGEELAAGMNAENLPGVLFRAISFEPGFQKYVGEFCQGCQLHVTDRDAFRPVETGLRILKNLIDWYPEDFAWKKPPYEYEYDKLPIEILCGRPEPQIFSETI